MNNRPYGSELLTVARRTLLRELLPLLPPEKAYEALMIANAMAIAARELAPHAGRNACAAQQISRFYSDIACAPNAEPSERDLAARIRARAIPAAHGPRLFELLQSLTEAKLALCNPKYLPG
jgi:hypothetical protein